MKRHWTALASAFVLMSSPAVGQWLNYRTPGIPREPDGRPNLSAPLPRTSDGKPDLSGVWLPDTRYIENIARDLKPEDVQFQPWAETVFKQRQDTQGKDDPTARCIPSRVPRSNAVPYPFKILMTPGVVVILYEVLHSYRQIFTDGRQLPVDPNPTWLGYSIGRWDGDAFVVDTTGFNDQGWLDIPGHPATERLHVTERFRRKDFGHLDIEMTIDDPKAYRKPWTMTLPVTLSADNELLEYICTENEKDLVHLVGK